MCNMKALSLLVKSYNQGQVYSGQTDGQKDRDGMIPIYPSKLRLRGV